MISISIAIVFGSALAFWGYQLPDPLWLSFLPVLLLLARYQPAYRVILLFFAAFLWASFHLQLQLDKRLPGDLDGEIFQISGVVDDIVELRSQSIRFLLAPDGISNDRVVLPDKIRLSWYRSNQFPRAGERWQFEVKLRSPSGFANPGGFDYERWLLVQGIGATGYVRKSIRNQKLADSSWWDIDNIRSNIANAVERHCQVCRHTGLYQALTIGHKGNIELQQKSVLQETGTAHLLAISGLHVGLVAALFYGLGQIFWRLWWHRYRINRLEASAALAILGAVFYAALAGFSIPTIRALVMLAVVFLALLLRRGINLLNSIAIALSLILIWDPLAVGSASLWLSISALLIIALGQYLLVNQPGRLRQLLTIQLLFSLLFIPLSLMLFNQASPAGFFANIVAIPLLSLVILPAVLLASTLAFFELSIAEWLFKGIDWLMGLLFDYLSLLLESGLGVYQNGNTPILLLLSATIGLLLLLLPLGKTTIKPALLLIVVPFFWQSKGLDQGEFRVAVLDVGMGTSIVVETKYHSLIYDFGSGRKQGFSAGEWVVKPYLRYRSIDAPDLMVISHADQDHSGGFYSFVDDVYPALLLSGTPSEVGELFEFESKVRDCHDYQVWRWDGVDFEFLSTNESIAGQSDNNRSCVLKVSGYQSVLLSGDIEAEQERRLINVYGINLKSDVLVAPHHGSLTSSTEAFVNQVLPKVTVFTLGRNNRWGFPKTAVTDRYVEIGSSVYRSDRHGAVTVYSQAGGMSIDSYRQGRNRLWNRD